MPELNYNSLSLRDTTTTGPATTPSAFPVRWVVPREDIHRDPPEDRRPVDFGGGGHRPVYSPGGEVVRSIEFDEPVVVED